MNTTCPYKGFAEGRYTLPALPYDVTAMEPFLDAETLTLHHDRHHAAYVEGANNAARILQLVAAGELEESAASVAAQQLAFHLGGHILHSLYWRSISPQQGQQPAGELAAAINDSFGSYDGFVKAFRGVAAGVQGSGWCVLGIAPMSRRLTLCGIRNHQDALIPGFKPLLACDVWEHAYYLRYQNNRAAYLTAFLKQIDWAGVEKRLERCCCHGKQS